VARRHLKSLNHDHDCVGQSAFPERAFQSGRSITSKSVRTILEEAAELLRSPDSWTQGELSRAEGGAYVNPLRQDAVCWCLEGAIFRAMGKAERFSPVMDHVRKTLKAEPCIWNDRENRTHAEVLKALAVCAAKA